ncbi:MAG: hypothetical protein K940chlam8_00264 [Chlamydiae bacterium]|nr:hypothetical protein [Chlamydiota bacterium]
MIIACFGEAKKGKMATPYYIKNTDHLYENLGEPIKDTQGLDFAIKTLHSNQAVLFFRVEDEGLSKEHYLKGLNFLKKNTLQKRLLGIYLAGCFDPDVVHMATSVCMFHKTLLLATQKELIDYLTL